LAQALLAHFQSPGPDTAPARPAMSAPGGPMAEHGGAQQGCRDSFHLITLFGIPIRVHLLLPFCMIAAGISAALQTAMYMPAIIMAMVISGPLLFMTVLVHEFGHMFAALRCGCRAEHILLWPLGGLAVIGQGAQGALSPKEQIFVSIMGPLTHLPMIAGWYGVLALLNKGHMTLVDNGYAYTDQLGPLVAMAMISNNVAMLLFNLLVPCFPLDCSQILVSAMLWSGYQPSFAAKILVFLSIPVLCVLVGLALMSYVDGSGSGSSLMSFFNVFMAFWLAQQTYALHQARVTGNLAAYPLFSSAMRGGNSASGRSASTATPGGQSVSGMSARSWKPFQGDGVTLGRPGHAPPGNQQVCMAALLCVAISHYYACSAAPALSL